MASRGEPDFANGIRRLAEAGCHVIVDDVWYPTALMFPDGETAQAVDQVVSQGIPYFASGGNYARRSWEAPLAFDPFVFSGFTYHWFLASILMDLPLVSFNLVCKAMASSEL
jgi:hypothetical protein